MVILLDKKEIKDGVELPGLGKAEVDAEKKTIKVDKILNITPENAEKIGF